MIQLCLKESSIAFMIEKISLVTRGLFVEIMDWPNYLERASVRMDYGYRRILFLLVFIEKKLVFYDMIES